MEINTQINIHNDKILKYKNLINNLDMLIQEKNKLDFNIKILKEKIDEYESNNLFLSNEFNKINNNC